jgi:hypothetical protein
LWPKLGEEETIMQVQVERCAGHFGIEMPVRFRFDAREVEIVENIDQWYGPDYCYFKIKGNDGNLYILRFDERRAEWEMTMFQSLGGRRGQLADKRRRAGDELA